MYIYIYTYMYIYMCVYIYIYIYIMTINYTVEKKRKYPIIQSAMETWKYNIIRNLIILSLCPFSKISQPS